MYGNDHSPGRDAKLLDPAVDAARVRAMYTSPAYARRGVSRLVLSLCEAAAAAEGFSRLELVATLSGGQLYGAYGFTPLERIEVSVGAVAVPAVRMEKHINQVCLADPFPRSTCRFAPDLRTLSALTGGGGRRLARS